MNHRESEHKYHEALYQNIKLLTFLYPPNQELVFVLKKDMFVNSNKAAFQQIIYYLFNILDPQATKEKITAWPLYDVKLETKFRNEVVSFINWINSEFEQANLESIMPSQFLTPGKYKFTRFMLSLSNFVIYNHLKKNGKTRNEIVAPVTAHKNPKVTNIILKNLKTQTDAIELQNNKILKEFSDIFNKALIDSNEIVVEREKIENDLCAIKHKLEEKMTDLGELNHETLTDRLESVKEKMEHLEKVRNLCEKSHDLLIYLMNGKNVIEFSKDSLKIPENFQPLLKDHELNLSHLFYSLCLLLEDDCLEMPTFTDEQLKEWIEFINNLNEKCARLGDRLTTDQKELNEMVENFHVDEGK